MLRIFENKKTSQLPEQSQVQLLSVLGSLPEGSDIEIAYSEPGDQIALFYKTEKYMNCMFRVFDCNTLTCLKEIDLQDKKPASGKFSAWHLPDGRYVMSLASDLLGNTYADTRCLSILDSTFSLSSTRLTPGKHLDLSQHFNLNEQEIYIHDRTSGIEFYNLSNLKTPNLSYSDAWKFGELAFNCLHQFKDNIFGVFYKNGQVRFYERQGKNFKDLNKTMDLSVNLKTSDKSYCFICYGSFIIMQNLTQYVIFKFKKDANQIKLEKLSSPLLPQGKIVGGYLLESNFARLIMFNGGDIFSVNPYNGTKLKIYSTSHQIKDVVVMKNNIFVQIIHNDNRQQVEVVKYETRELKTALTDNIKKGVSLFPLGVAAIVADYVGLEIAPHSI